MVFEKNAALFFKSMYNKEVDKIESIPFPAQEVQLFKITSEEKEYMIVGQINADAGLIWRKATDEELIALKDLNGSSEDSK